MNDNRNLFGYLFAAMVMFLAVQAWNHRTPEVAIDYSDSKVLLRAGQIQEAEQIVFAEVSTGAQDDLQRATDLVRHRVAQYGMSETLGAAVQKLLREAEARVHATLTTRRKELEALMHMLLREETVERAALLEILSAAQPAESKATVSHAA